MTWIEIGILAVGLYLIIWIIYNKNKKAKAIAKAEKMAKAGHRIIHQAKD